MHNASQSTHEETITDGNISQELSNCLACTTPSLASNKKLRLCRLILILFLFEV